MTKQELLEISGRAADMALAALPKGNPLELWALFMDLQGLYGYRAVVDKMKTASPRAERLEERNDT